LRRADSNLPFRREQGLELAGSLRRGVGVLSARQSHEPVRVQIDPLQIG
jgi:primosomal protein N' (replication factor Y)